MLTGVATFSHFSKISFKFIFNLNHYTLKEKSPKMSLFSLKNANLYCYKIMWKTFYKKMVVKSGYLCEKTLILKYCFGNQL